MANPQSPKLVPNKSPGYQFSAYFLRFSTEEPKNLDAVNPQLFDAYIKLEIPFEEQKAIVGVALIKEQANKLVVLSSEVA